MRNPIIFLFAISLITCGCVFSSVAQTIYDLDRWNGDIRIQGGERTDGLGFSVATGDINGDGIGDVIIGSPDSNPPGRNDAGIVYVIYGSGRLDSVIHLDSVWADITIYGKEERDNLGYSVSCGDVNGDRFDDIIIGALQASLIERYYSGATYVIFGKSRFTGIIDLDTVEADVTIVGGSRDMLGFSVSSGDINGDGIDDIITSALWGTEPPDHGPGATYVIFGKPRLAGLIDLDQGLADFTVYGGETDGESSLAASSGDINGDGIGDLIIGEREANPEGRVDAGATYVIYGNPDLDGSIDLSYGEADVSIFFFGQDHQFGYSVSTGNFNGDMYDDIIIGTPEFDLLHREDAGFVFIVYGGSELDSILDFASFEIIIMDIAIIGNSVGDRLGASVSSGDLNGDGIDDMIIGATGADPENRVDAGVTYVLFGSTKPYWIDREIGQFDITVYGDDGGDLCGSSVTSGDMNGDGRDDLIIGAMDADPENEYNAGETYVIFGECFEPVCEFSGSPDSGCAPLTVSFTDQTTHSPTSWSWSFGDGDSSAEKNPTYTFYGAGSYTITLVASNNCGSDEKIKTGYITVEDPAPIVQFTGSPTEGCVPVVVSFTDQSDNNPTAWTWSFGDGDSSAMQHPEHTYNIPGVYTITLVAGNDCGSEEETKTEYIVVNQAPPLTQFNGSPTIGCAPLTVSFIDQSTNTPTGWSWSFGDGDSSTLQHPSHTYTDAGSYAVTLIPRNACGSGETVDTSYITVRAIPAADFSGLPTSGDAPLTVSFSDLSTNDPLQWLWSFGDGGSSDQQNPNHIYTEPGNFTVSLIASNICGSDEEIKSTLIEVTPLIAQGDVNGDGDLNVLDMLAIANHIMNVEELTHDEQDRADCNGDKSVNVLDMIAIANVIIGIFEECPGNDYRPVVTPAVIDLIKTLRFYLPEEKYHLCMTMVKELQIPTEFHLAQNYPNPFNPITDIRYQIVDGRSHTHTTLKIYNLLGQEVRTLVDEVKEPGYYTATWDGRDGSGMEIASGIYFYRLTVKNVFSETKRMVLVR